MGELSATDERKYRSLQRATERELLQVSPNLPHGMELTGHTATFRGPANTIGLNVTTYSVKLFLSVCMSTQAGCPFDSFEHSVSESVHIVL